MNRPPVWKRLTLMGQDYAVFGIGMFVGGFIYGILQALGLLT